MKICLLTNQELDQDPFPADDWPCDPRPFLPEAQWHLEVLDKANSIERVKARIQEGFELFFNLCDGAADEDSPGIEVVETLEAAQVPFTGANSTFYEPSRKAMKLACERHQIPTPRWVLAKEDQDISHALEVLQFPMFVKHYSSYASVSLSRASRVRSEGGLRRQVQKIIRRHGAALIEEYIEGTECTVLVVENSESDSEPYTYPPMQYRFPPGESFKHSAMKWVDYSELTCFPLEDTVLSNKLQRLASKFFKALGGTSFGRCDFRVDPMGTPYMLEINPNCGVYYPPSDPGSADLILLNEPEGHRNFTLRLVEAALARHREVSRTEVRL